MTGGILLALMATVNPGDEVLIPDPSFVMYEYQTTLSRGSGLHRYLSGLRTQRGADPPGDHEEDTGHHHQQPKHPTGGVCSILGLPMVARIARETDILIFSDDIYERFFYEGESPPPCLGQLCEGVLTFGGFSKTWGMTGWRVGVRGWTERHHRCHGDHATVRLQWRSLGGRESCRLRP